MENPVTQPGRNGGTLKVGGVNVGAGRPKNEWRALLQTLASRDETVQHVEAILREGPKNLLYMDALKYATEHGFGKATTPISFDDLPTDKIIQILKETK